MNYKRKNFSRRLVNHIFLNCLFLAILLCSITVVSLFQKNEVLAQQPVSYNTFSNTSKTIIFETLTHQVNESYILSVQKMSYHARTNIDLDLLAEKEYLTYFLAYLITAEGGIIKSDYYQQLIAYAFVNRMRAPSYMYPDTAEGVLHQVGQYATQTKENFENGFYTDQALRNARIVVENYYNDTIPVPDSMVLQDNVKRGIPFDEVGNMYFGLEPRLVEYYNEN